ncbi:MULTISPECIES: extracellular solute-binding protein [unclassified Sphingomonas]|uniref:extracellular solute-binding protein n=1 Tax=unclassified Sphingomonas TaxID=196159 RepID=UPI00161C01C9|nr:MULTISPECIES: extracellular solute-binding protein [unclassified Sphingomonas]MBB3347046.1 multiple sugar transport system substrate-binding protein [Sphingomonas sp. BK069]MBB3471882.1 multiple sugar transport system substrate-binding protein [Sphingomonas sp. BK345]
MTYGGKLARAAGWSRRSVVAALSMAAAGGCAARRSPDTISLWAMSYEGDYSPMLMPGFTRATGVPVEVQTLPWTAAHEKLLTAQAGDSLPDVFMLPDGWVGEFALIGALAPVTDPALLTGLFPGVSAATGPDGRPYAVPWSVAPQVQYYRRDLLERAGYAAPPEDWDSWRRMGQRLKARAPDDYAFLMLLNWWDSLFTFAGQTGANPLRERDTRGNFRDPRFRDALAFYVSLFRERLAPPALSTEVQDPVAAFAQGYFAVYPYGPTLTLDLHRRAAEIPAALWSTARMPGPQGPGRVSGIAASLCVSARSRRPAAAWALVRHLTSPASELTYQRLIGTLPARAAAWATPQLRQPALAAFAEQMRAPTREPMIVEWERIRIEVQLIAERVVRGQLGIDAALVAMDDRVDRLLAKRRALVEAGRLT